eukprot:1230342-Lingulodinium_polyedra.AAC.1
MSASPRSPGAGDGPVPPSGGRAAARCDGDRRRDPLELLPLVPPGLLIGGGEGLSVKAIREEAR